MATKSTAVEASLRLAAAANAQRSALKGQQENSPGQTSEATAALGKPNPPDQLFFLLVYPATRGKPEGKREENLKLGPWNFFDSGE